MTHLDLMAAGRLEDPFFGENARTCEWMEEKDWWYSRTFELSDTDIGDRVEVVFEGLDTLADVWVNGHQVGSSRNALVPWRADITAHVRPGDNLIVVRLDTGLRWALGQDLDRYDAGGASGPREAARVHLRRSQFSFHWDWAVRLLTCGIWRPARVESHRELALRDVCVRSRLGRGGEAVLTALVEMESFRDDEQDVRLEFSLGEEVRTSLRATLAPGMNLVTHEFSVPNPRLWWPNGLGEPHCYPFRCRLSTLAPEREIDAVAFPYGIREIRLAQDPLPDDEGQSFTFVVNGIPVFCKGADWVPPDSLLSRMTAEKYDDLIREAQAANFNMFRIWGGGTYESEAFWEACDRRGIMVWLDFQFACAHTPEDIPEYRAEVAREGALVVRRLRNHPSLVLWCGNNENQWLYREGDWRAKPFHGWRTYHELLPGICANLDPTRPYWPSSPYGGPSHNDWDCGNRHAWHIAIRGDAPGGRTDYQAYATDRGKFISEYGFLAPPVRETLARVLPPEQLRVGSETWNFHRNDFEPEFGREGGESVIAQALARHFGRSLGDLELDAYIRLSQAWQAEAYRFTLSHYRRRKFLTSGTLFWMYDDCWPTTSSWTILDHYLRRKPSYYAVKRTFAPEMLAIFPESEGLSLWLVNDHLREVSGVLTYGLGRFSQPGLDEVGRVERALAANSAECLARPSLPDLSPDETADHYCWAQWLRDGQLIGHHYYWLSHWKGVSLPEPGLQWRVSPGAQGEHRLEVAAENYAWMVAIEPDSELSPDDNYFDLLPGQSRTISLRGTAAALDRLSVSASNSLLR